MKKYYAFQYHDGKNTTSGTPNKRTGRMNIAGELKIFLTKESRDSWVNTYYNRGIVTAKQSRELHLGLAGYEYQEMIDSLYEVALNQ